jgi:hypothetical protein
LASADRAALVGELATRINATGNIIESHVSQSTMSLLSAKSQGREIWLRRTSKLDEEQQKILYQLQLHLPERLEPIQIQKCSADSAIA